MTTDTLTPIQQAAAEARALFTQDIRDDGSEFWATTIEPYDEDHWVTRMCREAHGEMMPDDQRYRFIVDALDAIFENDDVVDARDSIESDPYTSQLLAWAGSGDTSRLELCDTWASEYGSAGSTVFDRLQGGQWLERVEVFDGVLQSVEAHVREVAR